MEQSTKFSLHNIQLVAILILQDVEVVLYLEFIRSTKTQEMSQSLTTNTVLVRLVTLAVATHLVAPPQDITCLLLVSYLEKPL